MEAKSENMTYGLGSIEHLDPEVHAAIVGEMTRQEDSLELIASENFVHLAILQAVGCSMTNKYAEGVVGRRYYGGCQMVDVVERLAQERACALFGAEYANVQPHSGTQANMAVFMSFLAPGDTILAMDLDAGGHLTHGAAVNFSGQLYRFVHYGVSRDTELIDYDAVAKLAHTHRPKMIIAGASAYSRQIDFARFGDIAKSVGALLLVDMAHIAGLIAAGEHPSPIAFADFVTTTTHKTLRGPRGGMILARGQYAKKLDSAVCPGIQGGPLMHVIAAKAIAFKQATKPEFKTYQQQIKHNARALSQGLAARGFRIVSGGTDNHLLLVDLRLKQLTGKVAEEALDKAGITLNKNKIPFDPEKPLVTSGIRLGTPAVTTRGLKEAHMDTIAALIDTTLQDCRSTQHLSDVHGRVKNLLAAFPLNKTIFTQQVS